MPVTDARMHRADRSMQRRGAEDTRRIGRSPDACLAPTCTCVGLGGRCSDGESRKSGEPVYRLDGPLAPILNMRRARAVSPRRGGEEERKVCWMEGALCSRTVTGMPSPTLICVGPGQMLQRRGAGEKRRIGWMEGECCYQAVTGKPGSRQRYLCIGQGGCCGRMRQDVLHRCVGNDRASTPRRGHCVGRYRAVGKFSVIALEMLANRFPNLERFMWLRKSR